MTNKEKIEIKKRYQEYVKQNGEPDYAICNIMFLDNKETVSVKIGLWSMNTDFDDEIFFYCDSISDLIAMTEEGVEDFKVVQVHKFEKIDIWKN